MNKQNYTTKETSQAISAVVEVETTFFKIRKGNTWLTVFKTDLHDYVSCVGTHHYTGIEEKYKTYSLSEALLAIEELGKVRNPKESLVSQTVRQQKLLVAWQQDGGRMNGEAVSEFLISLFKE